MPLVASSYQLARMCYLDVRHFNHDPKTLYFFYYKISQYQKYHNRSEERRVGKGVDLGGRRIIKKKKKTKQKTPQW